MFTISAAKPLLLATILSTSPGSHTSRNLSSIFQGVPDNVDFKYPMIGAMGPVTEFMPKKKADWTLPYFLSHPKELGLGLYLLEKRYYNGGVDAAKAYILELIDVTAKRPSQELLFDAASLAFHLPATVQLDIYSKRPSVAYNFAEPPANLSVSQVLISPGTPFSRSNDSARHIDRMLQLHHNNSYILSACAVDIEMFLENKQVIQMRGGMTPYEISSGYFTVAKCMEFYREAVKANPEDLGAWYGLGDEYTRLTHPNYGQALFCYRKAQKLLVKKGANPKGRDLSFLNKVEIPYLEKKVNPS